jgi:hypothetical protein
MRRTGIVPLAAMLVTLLSGVQALAQPSEDGFDKAPEDTMEGKAQLEKEKGEKMPGEGDKKPEPVPDDSAKYDPFEEDNKAYPFIGVRFRNIIVPKFMINIFADGGATVNVFSFGPEFTYRKGGTEWDIALTYADYSMDPFLFKGSSDGDDAWEIVSSDLKALYLTIDLLYDIPLDKKGRFSILIGGGVGIGAVFDELYRTQAYYSPSDKNNPDTEDINKWVPCTAPNNPVGIDPSTMNSYCDSSNDHFQQANGEPYSESSWANGGSKPFIFPWITLPQLSFRYKPIKQVQGRFDLGFSLTGFFLGLSAGYGL